MRGPSTAITWPAEVLLSVLVACVTALVWKGLVPSHALFAVGGVIVGWLVPRSTMPMPIPFGRKGEEDAVSGEEDAMSGGFTRDEVPTKRDAADIARTQPMPAKNRVILKKNDD